MRRCSTAAVLLALLALLAGCGGDDAAPARPLGAGGLGRALQIARDAGRLEMRLNVTTSRPGRGTRPQFGASGELDLGARAGKATLHQAGFTGVPDLTISWTADRIEGHGSTLSRAQARTSGGQLGMLPDETQAMAELVGDADDVRERGNGHWTFTVAPATAVRHGIPPQPDPGYAWRGEAWAAADGRLRRVLLRLPTPALGATIPAGIATVELTLG